MVGDAEEDLGIHPRLDEACGDPDVQAQAGKPSPSLQPAAEVGRQLDLFLRLGDDRLSWEKQVVICHCLPLQEIPLGARLGIDGDGRVHPLEDLYLAPQGQVDRGRPDVLLTQFWRELDPAVFNRVQKLIPRQDAHVWPPFINNMPF